MKLKRSTAAILSIGLLLLSYVLIRYGLFERHGMKQWPNILAIGTILIITTTLFYCYNLSAIITSFGYIIGYFIGEILNIQGTNHDGNHAPMLWLVWLISLIVIAIIGFLIEYFIKKNNKPIIF